MVAVGLLEREIVFVVVVTVPLVVLVFVDVTAVE